MNVKNFTDKYDNISASNYNEYDNITFTNCTKN